MKAWTQPVKNAEHDLWSIERDDEGHPEVYELAAEPTGPDTPDELGLSVATRGTYNDQPVPVEAALRLLAADASDREGLVWFVSENEARCQGWFGHWFIQAPGSSIQLYLGQDVVLPDPVAGLLATLQGKFLLEDAIRAAK